jgi:cell division protein ZapA
MSSEEFIKINVAIGGRTYPLRVPKDEEQLVKNIEKEINAKIAEMRNNYGMEVLDHIAMTLLTVVYEGKKNQPENMDEIERKVDNITSLIDTSL